MFHEDLDFKEIKKNMYKQNKNIMHTIIDCYSRGTLDTPEGASVLCGLLACVCEGKIEGTLNDDTKIVSWALTHAFEKEMQELQDALVESTDLLGDNLVKGPW